MHSKVENPGLIRKNRTAFFSVTGAILLDLLVYDAIGVIITLFVVLSGVLNLLGWGIAVIYLPFTAGSGYLLFKEKPFRQHPASGGA
jgi:hypothetical protein